MDEAQRLSVVAGAVTLFACGAMFRGRRARSLFVTSAVGSALGMVAYPRMLGLVMAYQSWMAAPRGRHWFAEFHDLLTFYTVAPVADTIPRGAAFGLGVGLALGLLWSGRGHRTKQDGIVRHRPSDS